MACKPCKEKSPCEELDLGCVPKVKDTCVELNKLINGLPLPLGTDYNTVVTYLLELINNIEAGESTGIDHITSSLTGNTTTVYLWADSAEEELIGSFAVTNGIDGSAGTNGADGQTIDHTSFTSSSLGGVAGQQGAVDTYTVWGDLAETISLGTFIIYNGEDGLNGSDGVSGESGSEILDKFIKPLEKGDSTAITGSWTSLYSYTLAPAVVGIDEYLEIDLKFQTNGKTDGGFPLNSLKLTYDGANIINKYRIDEELIPISNFGIVDYATYQMTLRLYETGETKMQATCNYHRNEPWGTPGTIKLAGAIQIDDSEIEGKYLGLGGNIKVEVFQGAPGANSIKLGLVIIKHIK